MTNAQIFLTLFNKIEQHLDQINNSTNYYGFRRLVDHLSKDNELVAHYKLELIDYLELRNAIVHKSTGKPIAEPHSEVIEQMQAIYDALTNPPQAMEIATHPVYTCTTTTPVLEIIQKMNQNFYTSIPVYHDGMFVGVFSDHSLTKWLAHIDKPLNLDDIYISQIQNYFDKENDKFNGYQFMAKNVDIFTVKKAFASFMEKKMRLGAIFLTKNGHKQEPIEAIVTAWDLPKMGK